jgi:iron(III) transport system ATP-binding protein
MPTEITINDLSKIYRSRQDGTTRAVDGVSLTIEPGELFFLLGPSGCGKTTLLRMIAGFIDPTGGKIAFDEQDVTHTPANKRDTGMVFQSYALWPHMSVGQNVGFGLDVRKVGSDEKARRVKEALDAVQMDHLADRKPTQLSGGQQQRVALARALVVRPRVLLLDEPLSNLDAKLRVELRSEIRRICKTSEMTTVYVTHDQKEALSMADRIAIMRDGKVMQIGDPPTLYRSPRTSFVASFLGETNLIESSITEIKPGIATLDAGFGSFQAAMADGDQNPQAGKSITVSIRPETLHVCESPNAANFNGKVSHTTYLGDIAHHIVDLSDNVRVGVAEMNPRPKALVKVGDTIGLSVNPEDVSVLQPE